MIIDRVTVKRSTVCSLSETAFDQISRLNFGEHGVMLTVIDYARDGYTEDVPVWLIRENGRVVAWALNHEYDGAMFYVKKTHRRQGLGKALLEAVVAEFPEPYVNPHDKKSWAFLGKYAQYPPHAYELEIDYDG